MKGKIKGAVTQNNKTNLFKRKKKITAGGQTPPPIIRLQDKQPWTLTPTHIEKSLVWPCLWPRSKATFCLPLISLSSPSRHTDNRHHPPTHTHTRACPVRETGEAFNSIHSIIWYMQRQTKVGATIHNLCVTIDFFEGGQKNGTKHTCTATQLALTVCSPNGPKPATRTHHVVTFVA